MRKSDLIFNFLFLPLDFMVLTGAALAAYFLRLSPLITKFRPVLFNISVGYLLTIAAALSIFFILLFAFSGLYSMRRRGILQETSRIVIAISAGMAAIIVLMFFNRAWFDSRFIVFVGWGFALSFVIVERFAMRALRHILLKKWGLGKERVLILGKESLNLCDMQVVATLSRFNIEDIEALHKHHDLHHILVVDTALDRQELLRVASFAEENGIRFSYIPDLFGSIVADMHFDILPGLPVVSVRPSPLDGWGKIAKRTIDLAGGALGLALFFPIIFTVAFAIKWGSKGPIFVKLKRVSQGHEFYLYKFRSMIDNAEEFKPYLAHLNERGDGPLFKMKDDPRVTRIGRFIRKRRLDELPQFINVVRGEMSLVGPRPHEPGEVARYKDYQKKVLAAKVGITGYAQVSGAHELPFDEEVKLDRYYIENWSTKKDIFIILKTAWLLFFDRRGV